MTALEFPLLQPAEILALEEVLLDAAEAGECGETLSFWESATHFIVLGYGNKVATEVNQPACERLKIPILRRISGGGTVLQGPGVLNYSLVLRAEEGSPLASITGANQFIMERNAEALTKLLNAERGTGNAERSGETFRAQQPKSNTQARPDHTPPDPRSQTPDPELKVEVQGHTDLAIAGRKFSGNAQRRKRTHLLFHGSLLLNADLALLDEVLPMPTLQPEYRQGRSHRQFLAQFESPGRMVKEALIQAWSATYRTGAKGLAVQEWERRVQELVKSRYSQREWNYRV